MKNSRSNMNMRLSFLKSCISYEQRKLDSEKQHGITVNVQSRLKAIEKMQKEIDDILH